MAVVMSSNGCRTWHNIKWMAHGLIKCCKCANCELKKDMEFVPNYTITATGSGIYPSMIMYNYKCPACGSVHDFIDGLSQMYTIGEFGKRPSGRGF